MEVWLSKVKLLFRFLRVKDWRAYLLIAFLGFILAKGFIFPLKEVFLFWLINFLFLGFGFSINECFDVKEDRYHKEKEKVFIGKKLSFQKGIILSFFISLLTLILSALINLKVFLFSLISLFLGLFYSAPPLRFKEKPFLDLISHGLFAGALIFLFPFVFFEAKLTYFHYLITLSIFYLSVILELRNHLEDYQSDLKANLKTTACFLGFKKTEKILRYLAIFYPLILLPLFLSQNFFLILFFIATLSFLISFLLSQNQILGKNYRIFDLYAFFSFSLLVFYA